MNLNQWAFFLWMAGGFLVSLSLVLWLAGYFPPESIEQRNELVMLYLFPAGLMYLATRFNPSLVERIIRKTEERKPRPH